MSGFNPAAIGALAKGDLENFLVASTPGGIEIQEAAGQFGFVSNETMPRKMSPDVLQSLETYGIRFGNPVDELFMEAQLPAGWKKVATDHSMWSNLIDDKGRVRALMFYKAAFYDQDAFTRLVSRFEMSQYEPADSKGRLVSYGQGDTHCATVVKDGGKVIQTFGFCLMRDYDAKDGLKLTALEWMKANYPDWQSPTSYWD